MSCEYCQNQFKHCGKYYIKTGFNNDPYLYVLRRDDNVGGVMIEYCPWCGRRLVPTEAWKEAMDEEIKDLYTLFDAAWEENMNGRGTDITRMVTTFVPDAIQNLQALEDNVTDLEMQLEYHNDW